MHAVSSRETGWKEPIVQRAWVLFLAGLWLATTSSAPADDSPPDTIRIHGFTVEYAQVGLEKLQRMQPSLEHQMEIVEQAGVPPATLEFFKTVPVVMVPKLDTGFGHAGRDETGRQIVEMKAEKLPADRPIL